MGPEDEHDPRGDEYEPRPHIHEGGTKWTFGKVHAAVHHVLEGVTAGNFTHVARELDSFSASHELGLGLGDARGQFVERAVRQVVADRMAAADKLETEPKTHLDAKPKGLHVLVLGAGIGSAELRCLPPLLEVGIDPWQTPHEIVSVEGNAALSDASSQLVKHAVGSDGDHVVRHLPLLPGEDTTLAEVLESLHDGYELGPFDVVLLEGRSRDTHLQQLETLVQKRALRLGAAVHAEGPGPGDAGANKYIQLLKTRGFEYEVQEVWPGASAIVARWQGHDSHNGEL